MNKYPSRKGRKSNEKTDVRNPLDNPGFHVLHGPGGRIPGIGSTADNLKAAADGELEEWKTVYPEFAAVAKEEGFPEIAKCFKEIAVAEKAHEKRYRALLKNLKSGKVFEKDEVVVWKCRNCGYVFRGKNAPKECPACQHPQAYFEVKGENY